MAIVKSRSAVTGILIIAGLAALGMAVFGEKPAPQSTERAPESAAASGVTDALGDAASDVSADAGPGEIAAQARAVPAPETPSPEIPPLETPSIAAPEAQFAEPKPEDAAFERRRLAMSGAAAAIKAARSDARIGGFRTTRPHAEAELEERAPGFDPNMQLKPAPAKELRREVLQAQAARAESETGPIEFIVKLKDRKLIADLRAIYAKSPKDAERKLSAALGDRALVRRARLQGFTLGGEAILRWDGPPKMADYAKMHDEVQRILSAEPAVAYAEQNYTADINSAH